MAIIAWLHLIVAKEDMNMADVRPSGIKKGWAIFWIVLFILLFIGTVIAFKMGLIGSDEIFHP